MICDKLYGGPICGSPVSYVQLVWMENQIPGSTIVFNGPLGIYTFTQLTELGAIWQNTAAVNQPMYT